ncbi:MAG: DsrE family protein [Hyphomicrobiales bacterium]|nr:DsrE family protein [Hyphomicrobiales bacterium]
MRLKALYFIAALGFALVLTAVGFSAYAYGSNRTTAAWVQDMQLPDYGKQQVIYHIDQRAGLFNGHYRHVLQVAQNHVDAVGADKLDLRIVLQGDGLDMLIWAKGNANAERQIDRLKAEGVKFEVCRNTLLARRLDPDKDLYGVKREDIVRAAVGEIAMLEQQGFQYIKP